MAEYFVRSLDSENARGPFTLEKLQSLAEVGQIDKQSMYYDHVSESWKPIGESEELCAQLFPQKKKLTLRKDKPAEPPPSEASQSRSRAGQEEAMPSQGVEASPKPAAKEESKAASGSAGPAQASATQASENKANSLSGMEIKDILDAAEGNTEHLHEQVEEKVWRDRAMTLSLPMLSGLMLLSGVSLVAGKSLVLYKLVSKGWGGHILKIFQEPLLLLGGIDLFMALVLALAVTSFYPLLRLRLMVGLGYLGWLSFAEWAAGCELGIFQLLALLVFTFGVYICTITIRFSTLLLAGLCGLAGVTALGLILNYPELFF